MFVLHWVVFLSYFSRVIVIVDAAGALVLRFGIRSFDEHSAVSIWSLRKKPEEGGPGRVLKYLYVLT